MKFGFELPTFERIHVKNLVHIIVGFILCCLRCFCIVHDVIVVVVVAALCVCLHFFVTFTATNLEHNRIVLDKIVAISLSCLSSRVELALCEK